MSELTLYKGEVFDFIDSPLNRKDAYRYFPDGALVVQDGKIIDCGPFKEVKAVISITNRLIIQVNS